MTPRAVAVKDGPLGPRPEAARSVLDGGEHGVTLVAVGTAAPPTSSVLRASVAGRVKPRFTTPLLCCEANRVVGLARNSRGGPITGTAFTSNLDWGKLSIR